VTRELVSKADSRCAIQVRRALHLLVRTVRTIGRGKNATRIEEYKFDRAVVTEICKCLKQAAIESGDWRRAPHSI
jgi:hypothetical protein